MALNIYFFTHEKLQIPKRSVLIMGDSHTHRALNPKYFNSALNLSRPAEPYLLTYHKLNKVLEVYTPDTLILGLGPQNLSNYNNQKFVRPKWASEMARRAYPLVPLSKIEQWIEVDHATYFRVFWRECAFYPRPRHMKELGGYKNFYETTFEGLPTTLQTHYHLGGKDAKLSKVSLHFLRAIERLCESKGVELVVINTPLHARYREAIPSEIKAGLRLEFERLDSAATVLNYGALSLPDSLFLNGDHLNAYGAKEFTKRVIKDLKALE